MSSLVRRIQRAAVKGRRLYMGRGSKLGVSNPEAADLIARFAREEKRSAAK